MKEDMIVYAVWYKEPQECDVFERAFLFKEDAIKFREREIVIMSTLTGSDYESRFSVKQLIVKGRV